MWQGLSQPISVLKWEEQRDTDRKLETLCTLPMGVLRSLHAIWFPHPHSGTTVWLEVTSGGVWPSRMAGLTSGDLGH